MKPLFDGDPGPPDGTPPDASELRQKAALDEAMREVGDPKDDVYVMAKQIKLLSQVALEAIRLVHGEELGDEHSHEPCGECGLGGHGAIRDALTRALGHGYTGLVEGKDMNVKIRQWNAALLAAVEREFR